MWFSSLIIGPGQSEWEYYVNRSKQCEQSRQWKKQQEENTFEELYLDYIVLQESGPIDL